MYDYHTHTGYSYDCYPYEPEQMIEKAIEIGIKEIAITDHFDPLFPEGFAEVTFPEYPEKILEVKEKYADRIFVAFGIELGLMTGKALEICQRVVEKWPFDFVLASFHSAKGCALHTMEYQHTRSNYEAVYDYYEDMLTCITEYSNFDVLGHINVIERYIDSVPDDSNFTDIQTEILKTLINKEKGIEINTSTYRYGTDRTIPTQDILNRYVSLGGKIVTTASDAHDPNSLGEKLDSAIEMLKKAGLNQVATFANRKVKFESV